MPDYLTKSSKIIYGHFGDEVVFIPQARADELAAVRLALSDSKTWDALLRRLAESSAEAHQFIEEFVEANEISADDPFDQGQIPAIQDGDWPAWPKQEMLAFVPTEIRDQFGEVQHTILNGDCLSFTEQTAPLVVAAFEAKGFIVARNDVAVASASGW